MKIVKKHYIKVRKVEELDMVDMKKLSDISTTIMNEVAEENRVNSENVMALVKMPIEELQANIEGLQANLEAENKRHREVIDRLRKRATEELEKPYNIFLQF
jgi:hypothetical protein